jgi:hypothetical protein
MSPPKQRKIAIVGSRSVGMCSSFNEFGKPLAGWMHIAYSGGTTLMVLTIDRQIVTHGAIRGWPFRRELLPYDREYV